MPAEPTPAPARSALAEAQTRLLAALVADAPPPADFDPQRIRLQARALLDKRARAVAARDEELACALGGDFPSLFGQYAAGRSRPAGGTRADAAAFAEHLHSRGLLPTDTPGHPGRWPRRPLNLLRDARQRHATRIGGVFRIVARTAITIPGDWFGGCSILS